MSQANVPDWFPLYVYHFSVDENVALMTNEQVGVYIRLLCHEWIHGSIPEDLPALAGLARTTTEHMETIWPGVAPCFTSRNGRLINRRLEEERVQANKRLAGARKGGKGAAEKAAAKRRSLQGSAAPVPVQVETEDWDRESAFGFIWELYPLKGRVKRPLSEQYFIEKVLHEADFSEMLTALRPGGKWAVSDKWAKGFVMNLPEWLNQERWRETPESADGAGGGTVYKKWEPPK